MQINQHYSSLGESYLFSSIAKRVAAFQQLNPNMEVIRLGIGDVTLPLAAPVIQAMHDAVDEMAVQKSFHGYGPEQGYDFLRRALAEYYASHNVSLEEDEIFISDGAKSDLGNILDLFGQENTVLVPDPVYPVYVDTNLMAGRRILYAAANRENGFLPFPREDTKADIIYLCSPNNPTGAAYNYHQLKQWVEYANEQEAIILFDAAYECFIVDEDIPHSIFEIDGAKTCAIEFCSFSKTAGFTGTRCGYTVVPRDLIRGGMSLRNMWLRRQTTKMNGVSYIVQRGAQAVFTPEGQAAIQKSLNYYRHNACVLAKALEEAGLWFCGGKNSPYLWLQCPGMDSWAFFDYLLGSAGVVGTPGVGFGAQGQGFFRITAFGEATATEKAAQRLKRAVLALKK